MSHWPPSIPSPVAPAYVERLNTKGLQSPRTISVYDSTGARPQSASYRPATTLPKVTGGLPRPSSAPPVYAGISPLMQQELRGIVTMVHPA